MPTYEANVTLVKNNKRTGGRVTIGLSRLNVITILRHFWKGISIKEMMSFYPQVDRDDFVVLKQLAKDIGKAL